MRTILQERVKFTATLQFGTQIFLVPQAMKIPAGKAAVDKECEKLEKDSGVEPDTNPKQIRGDR